MLLKKINHQLQRFDDWAIMNQKARRFMATAMVIVIIGSVVAGAFALHQGKVLSAAIFVATAAAAFFSLRGVARKYKELKTKGDQE